jgi:hypothetical protein
MCEVPRCSVNSSMVTLQSKNDLLRLTLDKISSCDKVSSNAGLNIMAELTNSTLREA